MKASMQKLIAMGLCVVLAVGSLTGCGGSSNDAGSASGDGAKHHLLQTRKHLVTLVAWISR